MDSGGFGLEVNFGLSILFVMALVLIVWGVQQRQVYEKRADGRVKLTIGASLMGAFALAVVMTTVVTAVSDPDDASADPASVPSSEADVALDGANRYLRAIDQVRVTGTSNGVGLDVTFVGDSDAVGSVLMNGLKVRILQVDGTTYLKPSDAFWRGNNDAGAIIRLVDGRWIRMDPKDERFAKLAAFADRDLLRQPLEAVRDYTIGAPETIDGVECIAVKPSFGGVLYVTPSPARLVRMTDGKDFVADLDYDAPTVTPKTPSRVVDGSEIFS